LNADELKNEKFLAYLTRVEGGQEHYKAETGRWMPYKDPAGKWTIGTGHLIGDGKSGPGKFKDGITETQRVQLLAVDEKKHRAIARSVVGSKQFDKLDKRRQDMLTDIAFNGGLHNFPNFKDAVMTGDERTMSLEHHRFMTRESTGKKVPLVRNQEFAKHFGLPWVGAWDAKRIIMEEASTPEPTPTPSRITLLSSRIPAKKSILGRELDVPAMASSK